MQWILPYVEVERLVLSNPLIRSSGGARTYTWDLYPDPSNFSTSFLYILYLFVYILNSLFLNSGYTYRLFVVWSWMLSQPFGPAKIGITFFKYYRHFLITISLLFSIHSVAWATMQILWKFSEPKETCLDPNQKVLLCTRKVAHNKDNCDGYRL